MKRLANRCGFTLLELLVAVTITLVLAGLMLTVVTNTLNLWHRTQDKFSTATQAKLLLDLVERDLQAAVFRKDGGPWLAVDVINTPASLTSHGWLVPTTSIKPATTESQRLVPGTVGGATPVISDARFGLSGAWLRFITTNVESAGSLPVAVSYQIARRPVTGAISAASPADVRYTLFRAAVGAANTQTGGNNVTAPSYASRSATPAGTRNQPTLTNPNGSDALATNVVDFGVWLHVRDTTTGGLRRIFPADNTDLVHVAQDPGAAADANRFPDVADVMVRILTEQGATLLAQMENGAGRVTRPPNYASDAEWWWAVVEANSHVYTRRIEVRGTAL
ncbi:prepilin-type N-terminal cleavage/methylation domain-containing protein [Opitutus sp. GAS368]|uniref:prepilin-type N-terminal cleavage/methylation domain-containing protein n=1 Tax=Opitutus sp. GAS368 TaxID=1882749 RepID=UPI000879B4DF|nr:prepilin-type N-terminal cleavage/methylation domain-containing protein [Opitutus sp. GAS368]SDS61169.1 prepilin-type N-terminal cleavage/methylation domain-containing protein [Opitutus sp. GAS368]